MSKLSIKFLVSIALCQLTQIGYAQKDQKSIDSLIDKARYIANVDSCNNIASVILKYAKAINYNDGMASAILIKVSNLVNEGQYDEALKIAYREEQIIFNSGNDEKIAHLISLRASCYTSLSFFEKSQECILKSKFYAQKIKDKNLKKIALGRVYSVLANNIQKNPETAKKLDSILFYRRKSYALYNQALGIGFAKSGLIIGGNSLADLFVKLGENDSAKYYYSKSLQFANENHIGKFLVHSNTGLAKVAYQQGNIDSALFYLKNALQLSLETKSTNHVNEIYNLLSKVYLKKGDTIKSLEFLEKYAKITDSISISDKNAAKASADILLQEKENSYTAKKKQYNIILFASALMLLILTIIVARLRNNNQRTKRHIKRQQLAHGSLIEQKPEIQKDKIDDEAMQEVIKLAMANDQSFLMRFIELHPIFIQRLKDKSPSLTTSELMLSAHLSLGFYTKEIARYTRTSVRAIESKKYRLRKKLNIMASEDLNVWMLNL